MLAECFIFDGDKSVDQLFGHFCIADIGTQTCSFRIQSFHNLAGGIINRRVLREHGIKVIRIDMGRF